MLVSVLSKNSTAMVSINKLRPRRNQESLGLVGSPIFWDLLWPFQNHFSSTSIFTTSSFLWIHMVLGDQVSSVCTPLAVFFLYAWFFFFYKITILRQLILYKLDRIYLRYYNGSHLSLKVVLIKSLIIFSRYFLPINEFQLTITNPFS